MNILLILIAVFCCNSLVFGSVVKRNLSSGIKSKLPSSSPNQDKSQISSAETAIQPPPVCPPGSKRDKTGECICILFCPEGQTVDHEDCSCIETPTSEPAPVEDCNQSLNECNEECPLGYIFDDVEGQCMCDISCEEEEEIDWDLCTCLLIDPEAFPETCDTLEVQFMEGAVNPSTYDSQLIPTPECPTGYIYDDIDCQCICADSTLCDLNFEWNNRTCECFCPRGEECAKGKVFDEERCQCVCQREKICRIGFVFDQETCRCSCLQTAVCLENLIFDHDLCKCVPEIKPICDHGFIFDQELSQCVCEASAVCQNLQIFDSELCRCVCPKDIQCKRKQRLNEINCFCEFID